MSQVGGHICLWGADFPPRRGGAARFHGAVARAFGGRSCVHIPTSHWFLEIPQCWWQSRQHRTVLVVTGEALPWGTVVWAAHMLGGSPYAIIVHGLDMLRARAVPRKRLMLRIVLRGAYRVLANSATTASLARAAGASDAALRIVHPPLGVTPDIGLGAHVPDVRIRETLSHSRIVLTVGRLVVRKGTDDLMRAMAVVQERYPRAALVVIGDGPERARLEALARSLRLHVRFLGACNDGEVAAWYRAADIVALTPKHETDDDVEGFGIVYLEGGIFAKPVVGTRSGGVEEAVVDGETGLLAPPEDPDGIARALLMLLSDDALRERLGAAGRVRAAASAPEAWGATLRAALE